jgi:hypothetical protein
VSHSVGTRIPAFPLRLVAGLVLAAATTIGVLAGTGPAQAATPAKTAPVAVPAVAPAQQDLGGQTLREYCQSFGWADAFQDGSSPTGWWCSVGGSAAPRVILDLNAECQWQFADIVRVNFIAFSVGGHCKTVATSFTAAGARGERRAEVLDPRAGRPHDSCLTRTC